MNQTFNVPPVKKYTSMAIALPGAPNGFPFLNIDVGSYINEITVQSNIDYDIPGGRHCIAIGKACALSSGITFLIDRNHDYGSVVQGNPGFLPKSMQVQRKGIKRKGSIILQNDVWIGNGATILSGVTLHNGCAVGANAVVAKDVPPYAIVAGNPAQIVRYRFDEKTILGLQEIAWWDWSEEVQVARIKDFALPPKEFVEKYHKRPGDTPPRGGGKTVLVIPDVSDPFPLYQTILKEYFEKDRPNIELLIYLPEEDSKEPYIDVIEKILARYGDVDCNVTLQTGCTMDERKLFQLADYFVTTRSKKTVQRTCLADLYQVKLLYGTDCPIFPLELQ